VNFLQRAGTYCRKPGLRGWNLTSVPFEQSCIHVVGTMEGTSPAWTAFARESSSLALLSLLPAGPGEVRNLDCRTE